MGSCHRFALSFSLLLSACGMLGSDGPISADGRRPTHPQLVLRTDGLDEGQTNALLQGCEVWGGEKIECVLEEAGGAMPDVTVTVSDTCVVSKEGKVRAGRSEYRRRRVTLYPACLPLMQSTVTISPEQALTLVVTHELGHMMGIWHHVPASCDEEHGESLDGDPICGPAIMNAQLDPALTGRLADADHDAFDLRDVTMSIVDRGHAHEKSAGGEPEDCTVWL